MQHQEGPVCCRHQKFKPAKQADFFALNYQQLVEKKLSFNNAYLVLDRADCMSFQDTVLGRLLDLMKSCPPGLKILVVGQAFGGEF